MIRKALVCCLALWSAGALAQDKSGAYLGGGLGQFDFHEEGDGTLVVDDTALAYKVYGGYRFNDTWAVEGAFWQPDELTRFATQPAPGIVNATVRAQYDFLETRGLAHVKAFFAGIGYWEADLAANVDVNTTFGPFSLPGADSDSGVSVVLGGQWDLERVGIRVEVEAYEMDNVDSAYYYGVGVHYRF
jgi:hypothetical protein